MLLPFVLSDSRVSSFEQGCSRGRAAERGFAIALEHAHQGVLPYSDDWAGLVLCRNPGAG